MALLVLGAPPLHAQKKGARIWATASFNKEEVMVGEPLVVTVTVYTSTWFTQPPIFGEIQVANALMVRLQQRNGSKMVTIGRKQYPAIQQRFVVYPQLIGKNTLPSFEVTVECPPEGGYKGIKRVINTKERVFTVLAPPNNITIDQWLTAYDVSLKETWDRSLKNLKAGDVLERRLTIKASGALAAAIPPLHIDSLEFASVYPKTPILSNRQNQASFSGSRTEIITYLIEKDGDFEIPETKVSWYSLRSKEVLSKSFDAVPIKVAANPDLEFILSRQKALQEELAKENPIVEEQEAPFTFYGLNWWQLLLVILVLFSIIIISYRLIKKLTKIRIQRNKELLESEAHYFSLLKQSLKNENNRNVINKLFSWYDRFRGDKYNPEIKDFIAQIGIDELNNELSSLSKIAYHDNKIDAKINSGDQLVKVLDKARKQSLNKKEEQKRNAWSILNPR